jgi:DNA-binding HxlR family transcriptional regulator
MATEILGDRWTLLIVRDLLLGVRHFNDLERGLPGISRGLLSARLSRLEQHGVLEKHSLGRGRKTEYRLTPAGTELNAVINSLTTWGARWAFGEPEEEQLDPILLMRWMRGRIRQDKLPRERMVVQFDFYYKKMETYWLLLNPNDVSVCLTHPGFDTDILVTADLSSFFQLWLGRISYKEALESQQVQVEGLPALVKAFPTWFTWSPAAPVVGAFRQARSV